MICLKQMVIRLKKWIIPCVLPVLLAGAAAVWPEPPAQAGANKPEAPKTYFEPETPSEGSLEELYQDVFMTMLLPYIQEAVSNYYEENTGYSPNVDPWQPDILSIERPGGYRTFLFVITLEVKPYLGAHISIGLDRMTVRVSSGEVKIETFEHIESYPVPSWLQ